MQPKRILISDDETNMRRLVRGVLDADYEFSEAADASQAIALARELRPAVVVLDVMLPGDGRSVLAELRGDPDLAGIPIVVLTAWPELEDELLAAGADRFLAKPFEPDALKTAVEELLGRSSA